MKRVNNSKKKYDDDDDNYNDNAPLINNSPREARLDDIVYGYGGEEAICRSGPDTPVHVLRTYKELCLLQRRRGDIINSIVSFIDNDKHDNITINSINNECFQFVQSLLSKWNRDKNGSSRPFGSRLSL